MIKAYDLLMFQDKARNLLMLLGKAQTLFLLLGKAHNLLLFLDKVVETLLARKRELHEILQPQTLRSGKLSDGNPPPHPPHSTIQTLYSGPATSVQRGATKTNTAGQCVAWGDGLRVGWLWEGYHESKTCSKDTYPESYIPQYTGIRRIVS